MSNTIQVGKQYKLVDISKDLQLQVAVENNLVHFPADKIFTVTELAKGWSDGDIIGLSDTKGLHSLCTYGDNHLPMALSQSALDAGAFEEVVKE